MSSTTVTRQQHNGAWWEYEDYQGVPCRCRLTGPDDQSSHERFAYDPKCGLCWLGYGHSADYHAMQLAEARIRELGVRS